MAEFFKLGIVTQHAYGIKKSALEEFIIPRYKHFNFATSRP